MDDTRKQKVGGLGWVTLAQVLIAGLLSGCQPAKFTISGDARELIFPGVAVPLDVEFTNPHDLDLSVVDLRVTVQDVNAPYADDRNPCSVDDFEVVQVSQALEISVPANETVTLSSLGVEPFGWPHVGMLNRSSSQAGCEAASLTFGYKASGRLAKL